MIERFDCDWLARRKCATQMPHRPGCGILRRPSSDSLHLVCALSSIGRFLVRLLVPCQALPAAPDTLFLFPKLGRVDVWFYWFAIQSRTTRKSVCHVVRFVVYYYCCIIPGSIELPFLCFVCLCVCVHVCVLFVFPFAKNTIDTMRSVSKKKLKRRKIKRKK